MNPASTSARAHSAELAGAIEQFENPPGYLAAASIGLIPKAAASALSADLEACCRGEREPQSYDAIVERTRALYARLVGVDSDRVATGSQTSVMTSVIASAVPAGAEVLCVDGDFSSIVFPFLARAGITVRSVPIEAVAESIRAETWLVAFSLVQSATGVVADVASIRTAAAATGTFILCDLTQAAGVYPCDASLFDATVCHSYKWLCSPRGVAFLTLSRAFQELLTPIQAGWYAGADVWQSCYGPNMHLAASAREFDVSPVWQAWVGAEHSIGLFAGLDIAEVWAHTSRLGNLLAEGLQIPIANQAIVSWADPAQVQLKALSAAGVKVSGRAGRVRTSFHLWNTESDVAMALAALGRA